MPDVVQEPGRLNVTCTKNSAFSMTLTFTGVDIAGWTWACSVVDLANGTHTPTLTPGSGTITVSFTDTEVNAMALGVGNWYLDRTDSGSERRYIAGDWNVIEYHV